MSHKRRYLTQASAFRGGQVAVVRNALIGLLVFTVSVLVVGCSTQQNAQSETEGHGVAKSGGDSGELYGHVVARMGRPESEESFVMALAVPEFRVELRNYLDPKRIEAGEITLRECTWSVGGPENVTSWFQEKSDGWRLVHSIRWQDGDEF